MAGLRSAAARVPFGKIGDAALLRRFASTYPDLAPRQTTAGREALDVLSQRLPERFPPLYEQLVTTQAWEEEVDLGTLRLLANPAGPDLASLAEAIFREPRVETLLAARYLPFAEGSGEEGGPICFDANRRRPDRDCPVVRVGLDGEVAEELAPSFRALLESLTSG